MPQIEHVARAIRRSVGLSVVALAAVSCVSDGGGPSEGTTGGRVPVVTPSSAYGPFPYIAPEQRRTFDAYIACAAKLGLEYEGPYADSTGHGVYLRLAPGETATHAERRAVERGCPQGTVALFGTPVTNVRERAFEHAARRFSACVSARGVSGFGEPLSGGDPVEAFWDRSFRWSSAVFVAAVSRCIDPLKGYLFP